MELYNIPGSSGVAIEAKGAWVDDVYYNVTCTIPWPSIGENGVVIGDRMDRMEDAVTATWSFRDDAGNTRTNENSTVAEYKANYYRHFYEWKEGVQGYEYSINDGTGTTKYTYLNIDGTWVDVTGRVTFDKEPEPEKTVYSSKGGFGSQFVSYNSGYDRFFEAGESRLLIISGSWDVQPSNSEGYINPIDVIQSGVVQTLTRVLSSVDIEFDREAFLETHISIDTHTEAVKIQELTLTQVENSYIYNTVLSDNQMFQLDQYGFEVFIVSVR